MAAAPPPQATIVNVTALARMTIMMLEVNRDTTTMGADIILQNISLDTGLHEEVGENILWLDSKKTIISDQPLRNR